MNTAEVLDFEPVLRLSKDLKNVSKILSKQEARYLVDTYYLIQDQRKRADNQIRAFTESGEPHDVIDWLSANTRTLENQIKRALDAFSSASEIGVWSRSVIGIGPVIAAGLIAHIDIEKAKTAGSIWRYAGLDPSLEWKKGEKRPWNASLKVLCWKIGESFVKVSGKEDSLYGRLYIQRKERDTELSEAGEYADYAIARASKVGKNTEAYKAYVQGKLPKGQIHARAKRYAVKIFLSHYHEKLWELTYGEAYPRAPYPIDRLGHVTKIEMLR